MEKKRGMTITRMIKRGLSVIVQRFVDKGYVLADKCLLDNLDKIGDGLYLSILIVGF